ncbi:hypothetical protein PILCRDRAFT_92606 [Piloderma croceum F 1598]|uniref:Uncharacterized protein n=1 Tax=Piloderma croceum (strain F 1598) TaxID=765440 RepID=A0A0C3F3B9_PILCF|nr:hypothetical protein PILCRDRAFT_92606 [Piloderma croceum F 1598]
MPGPWKKSDIGGEEKIDGKGEGKEVREPKRQGSLAIATSEQAEGWPRPATAALAVLHHYTDEMVGLAIPGFIIDLNGLAAIFDKSCLVWKTIAQAQDFGEDVADWMRKLEMEFFRF